MKHKSINIIFIGSFQMTENDAIFLEESFGFLVVEI